jgi:hypothetical protein
LFIVFFVWLLLFYYLSTFFMFCVGCCSNRFFSLSLSVWCSQPMFGLQAGVTFSQASGSSGGGPAPAHLQPSGLQNQQSQVVIMPQPPPHSINQPPHSHPHAAPHLHPQNAAAAAQFQQHLQQGRPLKFFLLFFFFFSFTARFLFFFSL